MKAITTYDNDMGRLPTVVIVEDERQISEILQEMLEGQRFNVIVLETASFTEFTARCPSAPDLLVCDLNLPGGSGTDLCRMVVATYPKCKVILMTGSDNSDKQEPLPSRPNPPILLRKPFSLRTFLNMVTDLVAGVPAGA
jgi:DNA-binding response OmpR family regulator